MSKPLFEQPEQDSSGDGELPTYEAVADQQGPNSRFGRWRNWIEKRAAERYADITPAEAARRLARGWGESGQTTPGRTSGLHLQTEFQGPPPNYPSTPPQASPPPFIGEPLPPTHLRISQFGSRFLPHSTAPIHCLLPLLSDRLLLIGHDEGLSILNMYPKEWTEQGLSDFGPTGAAARLVWEGESVHQLSLLEVDGDDVGIVMALVGSCQKEDCPKDSDSIRTLRMYNLSSLLNLAKWAASNQYNGPLDLRRTSSGNPQKSSKKKSHKAQSSLTRGLKSLGIESPISQPVRPFDVFSNKSTSSMSSLATAVEEESSFRSRNTARSDSQGSVDSSWDVVEDQPLKWASDYVSLATPGSRLAHTNVLFYDTWSDEAARGRKGALLAVGTKSAILLYETPRGERAFRFVKEFYTPLTPRSMSFVHQSLADPISRSPSDIGPSRSTRSSPSKIAAHISSHQRSTSMVVPTIRCPNQLSVFVTFEKKAGIIRIFDSSVGEVELYDEGTPTQSTTSTRDALLSPPTGSISKRNRASWDGFSFIKDKPNWILPTKVDLASTIAHSNVYLLTRSKRTHLVPYPLPASLPATPSYRILTWISAPKHVQARVCRSPHGLDAQPPFLQIIAFGDDGVEVQEIPLHSLSERKGKGRAVPPVHAMADFLGGETAPLCNGGHWHLQQGVDLARFNSVTSYATATSFDTYETDDIAARFRAEQGIYGWVRKGISDWRVFWLGGTAEEVEEEKI